MESPTSPLFLWDVTHSLQPNHSNILKLISFYMRTIIISTDNYCVYFLFSYETYAEVLGYGQSNTNVNSAVPMRVEGLGDDDAWRVIGDDDSESDYEIDSDGEEYVLPRGRRGQKFRNGVQTSKRPQDTKPPSKRNSNSPPCTAPPPQQKTKPSNNSVISYTLPSFTYIHFYYPPLPSSMFIFRMLDSPHTFFNTLVLYFTCATPAFTIVLRVESISNNCFRIHSVIMLLRTLDLPLLSNDERRTDTLLPKYTDSVRNQAKRPYPSLMVWGGSK